MENSFSKGIGYIRTGFQLMWKPGFKRYILVPIAINILIFTVATSLLFQYFGPAYEWIAGFTPGFLEWLLWLLSAIFVIFILLIYGYSFNIITTILAAPFYGLLAQKVELQMTQGQSPPEESFTHMLPRVMSRELQKLWYFLSRGLGVFILSFILGLIVITAPFVPILGILWAAWTFSIQFTDYPSDNNQRSFKSLRQALRTKPKPMLGFGGAVMLGSMIPVINIFISTAAVIGGVLFWLEHLSENE